MKHYSNIALTFLFVTSFPLFLGWVPMFGVMIPQILFFIITLLLCPNVVVSKPVFLCYIFFLYRIITSLIAGESIEYTSLLSQFFKMILPIYISIYLFIYGKEKEFSKFAIYSLVVTFITLVLSIRLLLIDGSALRLASIANSRGEIATLYMYWKQGMADYSMAAMMMFMPIVLSYLFKDAIYKGFWHYMIYMGIAIVILFLFLGQVTAPFLICIFTTFLYLFVKSFNIKTAIFIGAIFFLLYNSIDSILTYAILYTGDSAMNEKFVAFSMLSGGNQIDDSGDVGIRSGLLNGTVSAFLENPLFGGPKELVGGHNYFLDGFALYGVIGFLPVILLIKNMYKIIINKIPDRAKYAFLLIFIGFVFHGIIKNMSGTDYWNYLFIFYPSILIWGVKLKKNI